jgi:hypothetical protein
MRSMVEGPSEARDGMCDGVCYLRFAPAPPPACGWSPSPSKLGEDLR